MFKPVERDGLLLGYGLKLQDAYFFFGAKNLTREALPKVFPKYRFAFLKQVHGRKVVVAHPEVSAEADAHYTSTPGLALVSQSADCMPVLLAAKDTVCAIHTGWRGMALNIIASVHETLPRFRPTAAAIGPHILFDSFEVGRDVAEKLGGGFSKKHDDPAKLYFDLAALARMQLQAAFGPLAVHECLRDTLTDTDFHSFRRGKEKASRQFSFVVIDS